MTDHSQSTYSKPVSRRTVLKAGAAAGVLAGGAPFIRSARAAEPIQLGLLLPKSGPYAVQGQQGHDGARIALDEFGGKVNGRPVELTWLDEHGPQSTQQNMRTLVEEVGATVVQGGISSGDILACMPVAARTQTPLMASGPNATQITGAECNRYTFRVDLPNYVTVRTVYPHLSEAGKNWYFIYASYAWGIDGFEQMKQVLTADGGTVIGADQAPLGTTDFTSFILKVAASDADVLFLGLGGRDLTIFLKQFYQMGLTGSIPISALVCNDTDLWAAGPEAAAGIYPKIWNHTGDQLTEKSREFVSQYTDRFGVPPESQAWQDYFAMSATLTALRETGSTNGGELVSFLEGHPFQDFKQKPIQFRPWDHQLIQPVLVVETKESIADEYDYFNVVAIEPGKDEPLDSIYPNRSESLCSLSEAG